MTPKQSTIEAEAKEKAVEYRTELLKNVFHGNMTHLQGIVDAYIIAYIAGANRPPINMEGLREKIHQAILVDINAYTEDYDSDAERICDSVMDLVIPHLRSNVETTTEG